MDERRVLKGKKVVKPNSSNSASVSQNTNTQRSFPNFDYSPNSSNPQANFYMHGQNQQFNYPPSQMSYQNFPSQIPYSIPPTDMLYSNPSSQNFSQAYNNPSRESFNETRAFSHQGGWGSPGEQRGGFYSQLLGSEHSPQGIVDSEETHEMEVVPESPDTTTKRTLEKWSERDDSVLVGAWFSNSTDCVLGTNQNNGVFWQKITKEVNDYSPGCTRTLPSCKGHWQKLSKDVGKFVGCYRKAVAMAESRGSGSSPLDVKETALSLFLNDVGRPFKFLHVYDVCKRNPKFIAQYGECRSRSRGTDEGNGSDDHPQDDVGTPQYPTRPMGVKQAKSKASGKGKGKSKSQDEGSDASSRMDEFKVAFERASQVAMENRDREKRAMEHNQKQVEAYEKKMQDNVKQRKFLRAQSARDREVAQHRILATLMEKAERTPQEEAMMQQIMRTLYP